MLGLSVGMAIACVVVVYVGSTVQASIGIGLGMIASPMLLLARAISVYFPAFAGFHW